MVFKEYFYGEFRKEIKALLRKRLNLKDKKRYHIRMITNLDNKLTDVEKELNKFLNKAKSQK